jgi:YbbR domain-containing protein
MRRLLHNWPQKLVALVLAVLLWLFVSTSNSSITQKSLRIPLTVIGLNSGQAASGVPSEVEITFSGPSSRVDILKAGSFDAMLDLSNTDGAFTKAVTVSSQQGITLERINPAQIEGAVATRVNKKVPVKVAFLGQGAGDSQLTGSASPAQVEVSGPQQLLARVSAVIAPTPPTAGKATARVYAADAAGNPLGGVALEPKSVTVNVRAAPVLHTREVAVKLKPPKVGPFKLEQLTPSQDTLKVAGSAKALQDLTAVPATVKPPTSPLAPGAYTLEVQPQLPAGVMALERLTATVRLAAPQDSGGSR